MPSRLLLALLVLLPVLLAGCDSTNPVAPEMEDPRTPATGNFRITVSADPPQLQAGSGRASTVTVDVVSTADELPPPDGTAVTVTSSAGSFNLASTDAPVRTVTLTLTGGRAQVSLFPDPDPATATLLAQVGENTSSATVEFLEALPDNFFLTGIEPNAGSPDGGDTVVIRGAGFAAPLRVTFGGVLATVMEVTSSTVTVATPPSASPLDPGTTVAVDVTVTNDLTSETPPMDTLTGGFLYTLAPTEEPPAFFVSGVEPSSGPADGGQTVIVRGEGFRGSVQVTFGAATAPDATVLSDTQIRAVTPPSPQPVAAGDSLLVDVGVVNALGQSSSSTAVLVGAYRYTRDADPVPDPVVISGISPGEGPIAGGTVVTVSGSGFPTGSPVEVTLAGVRQRAETVIDASTVQFTTVGADIPDACPSDGRLPQRGIEVSFPTAGLSGSSGDTFTYTFDAPRITNVSPNAVSQFGSNFTVTGSGFGPDAGAILVDLVASDGSTIAAEVRTVTDTRIDARSPQVADDFFTEEDCVTSNNTQGKRFRERSVGVRVTDPATGCAATAGNALLIQPSDQRCREVEPGPDPEEDGG
jgi:large repetitive protein